ncbi:hypothetical protein [Devosia submarina]|uniref:hypothetical protein n=1 Tax=Devosia submarina TaxID=1173082 RepID=UPI000D356F0D|nr:hypothetical protein [Devosia submarina]
MRSNVSVSARLSLLALVGLFFAGASLQASHADGRADWVGYAWQKIEINECDVTGKLVACPIYHQKWDWKRNQWVDINVTLDLAAGRALLTQRLTNNDPYDHDYVCVTAVIVDADGGNLVAYHQNWGISSGDVLQESFAYLSPALATAATIHIGSKQCREGASQDDDVYRRVLANIGR